MYLLNRGGPAPRSFIRFSRRINLRSEHAFRSFASLYREKSAFARCQGFILHEKGPYLDHASEITLKHFLYKSIKCYKKTCTKLMHYKFDKAYSFIKLCQSIVSIKLYRHTVPTGKSRDVLHLQLKVSWSVVHYYFPAEGLRNVHV